MANLNRADYDQVWSEAIARCKRTLGEEDYEIVSAVESPEKLASAIKDLERKSARGGISNPPECRTTLEEASHLRNPGLIRHR